jgi:hypothetical protein
MAFSFNARMLAAAAADHSDRSVGLVADECSAFPHAIRICDIFSDRLPKGSETYHG